MEELFKLPSKHGGFHLARSFDEFGLGSLERLNPLAAMLGGDRFTEVYIKTESGNIYRIHKNKSERWLLSNSRNGGVSPHELTDGEILYGRLSVGAQFFFGRGGRTSRIKQIVCFNGNRVYGKLDTNKEPKAIKEYHQKVEILNKM